MAVTATTSAGSCSVFRISTFSSRHSATTTATIPASPSTSLSSRESDAMSKTYPLSRPVDFAIVGSGAAGGVLARELSMAGFSVVVLEQGPRLTLADFEHDELKYWFSSGITNDVVRSPQTFRDEHAKRGERNLIRPSLYYARTVGGTSVHYTANYWRFHEVD